MLSTSTTLAPPTTGTVTGGPPAADARTDPPGWAALLLVVRVAGQVTRVLLCRRSQPTGWRRRVWDLPGTDVLPGEAAYQAAVREALDLGVDLGSVALVGAHTAERGDRSRSTILAEVDGTAPVRIDSASGMPAWVRVPEVASLALSPEMAESWPELLARLEPPGRPARTAAVALRDRLWRRSSTFPRTSAAGLVQNRRDHA